VSTLPLERLRQVASRYPDALLVVVFGSSARGEAAAWSDLDIGVSGLTGWPALELAAELGEVLDREPHLVDLDQASDWLRYRVAAEGILLREAASGEWARFVARAILCYFDLAPIIALCAEGARRALARGCRDG
jgi:predicted nucleotidyltransferase